MKIVQSFWSGNNRNLDKSYGWLSPKYHWLGWVLSVNQLKQFYDEVELITDKIGNEILIEKLKLPYSKVHIILDDLNIYNESLWALAKIKSYSFIDEPFLHVDGDVFIWEEFDDELLKKEIIVQNIETTTEYYRNMWTQIFPHLQYIPSAMDSYHKGVNNKAYNMGVFGGKNLNLIKKYCEESFSFVNRNQSGLDKINLFNFNIFFEQVLFYEMAKLKNQDVSCLIIEDIGDNEYKGFGSFDEVPNDRTYLHLLGFFKRQPEVCLKLKTYVHKHYPYYYDKIEELLNIEPKLSSFKYEYSIEKNTDYQKKYIHKLLQNIPINNELEEIFCRNITLEGKVIEFYDLLDQGKDFFIIPTSCYKITHNDADNQDYIDIKQVQENDLHIPLMNIDHVIFNELDGIKSNKDFEVNALQYLDDDFPFEEQKAFIETLWKRISYFISLCVFIPIHKEEYIQYRKLTSQK
ncbi:MAG: hypothetical protein QM564_02405 [Bergeyella sp.]